MFSSSLTAFHLLLIILHSQFVYIICYVIAVGPPITRSRNYAGFVTLTNTQTVVFVDISMFHTAQPTSTLTTAFSFFSLVMYEIMILVFRHTIASTSSVWLLCGGTNCLVPFFSMFFCRQTKITLFNFPFDSCRRRSSITYIVCHVQRAASDFQRPKTTR